MSVPDLDESRPLLIMANKQDQPGAMRADEVKIVVFMSLLLAAHQPP